MVNWQQIALGGRRLSLPLFAGLFLAVGVFILFYSNAQALRFTGGAYNCGAFIDAVAIVPEGGKIVQMDLPRDSDGATITKSMAIMGGWTAPTSAVSCTTNNMPITGVQGMLDVGFAYVAPITRSVLEHDPNPVLTISPSVQNLLIEHMEFHNTDNVTVNGAGINGVISNGANIKLENVKFDDDNVTNNGGGLHLEINGGSRVKIVDSVFSNDSADNSGGGMYIELRGSSYLTIENTSFANNSALNGGSFEIHIFDNSRLIIKDSTISGSATSLVNGTGGGGRLIINEGHASIMNTTFQNNSAGINGQGGGLYVEMDGGQLDMNTSRFDNNIGLEGGGLYVNSVGSTAATVNLINVQFSGNGLDPLNLNQSGSGTLNQAILGNTSHLPVAVKDWDPSVQRAKITKITRDENLNYIVEFEVFNFTPDVSDVHLHFFFDTVPPDQAGTPAPSSNWKIYGGASPFTGYSFVERPDGLGEANEMCVLVANPNHSIRLGTGNCVELP